MIKMGCILFLDQRKGKKVGRNAVGTKWRLCRGAKGERKGKKKEEGKRNREIATCDFVHYHIYKSQTGREEKEMQKKISSIV